MPFVKHRSTLMMLSRILLGVITLYSLLRTVDSQARLLFPIGRSSRWREEYGAPENFEDHLVNCGGYDMETWEVDLMCGVCGDNLTVIAGEHTYMSNHSYPNEAGGMYAGGAISAHFNVSDVIVVKIQIMASRRGYIEFNICPNNDFSQPSTAECMNEHPLRPLNGTAIGYRWYVPGLDYGAHGYHYVPLQLPEGLKCAQCVLRMRWRTGSNWGDENGVEGLGYGPQEYFFACSDIQIGQEFTEEELRRVYTENPNRPGYRKYTPYSKSATEEQQSGGYPDQGDYKEGVTTRVTSLPPYGEASGIITSRPVVGNRGFNGALSSDKTQDPSVKIHEVKKVSPAIGSGSLSGDTKQSPRTDSRDTHPTPATPVQPSQPPLRAPPTPARLVSSKEYSTNYPIGDKTNLPQETTDGIGGGHGYPVITDKSDFQTSSGQSNLNTPAPRIRQLGESNILQAKPPTAGRLTGRETTQPADNSIEKSTLSSAEVLEITTPRVTTDSTTHSVTMTSTASETSSIYITAIATGQTGSDSVKIHTAETEVLSQSPETDSTTPKENNFGGDGKVSRVSSSNVVKDITTSLPIDGKTLGPKSIAEYATPVVRVQTNPYTMGPISATNTNNPQPTFPTGIRENPDAQANISNGVTSPASTNKQSEIDPEASSTPASVSPSPGPTSTKLDGTAEGQNYSKSHTVYGRISTNEILGGDDQNSTQSKSSSRSTSPPGSASIRTPLITEYEHSQGPTTPSVQESALTPTQKTKGVTEYYTDDNNKTNQYMNAVKDKTNSSYTKDNVLINTADRTSNHMYSTVSSSNQTPEQATHPTPIKESQSHETTPEQPELTRNQHSNQHETGSGYATSSNSVIITATEQQHATAKQSITIAKTNTPSSNPKMTTSIPMHPTDDTGTTSSRTDSVPPTGSTETISTGQQPLPSSRLETKITVSVGSQTLKLDTPSPEMPHRRRENTTSYPSSPVDERIYLSTGKADGQNSATISQLPPSTSKSTSKPGVKEVKESPSTQQLSLKAASDPPTASVHLQGAGHQTPDTVTGQVTKSTPSTRQSSSLKDSHSVTSNYPSYPTGQPDNYDSTPPLTPVTETHQGITATKHPITDQSTTSSSKSALSSALPSSHNTGKQMPTLSNIGNEGVPKFATLPPPPAKSFTYGSSATVRTVSVYQQGQSDNTKASTPSQHNSPGTHYPSNKPNVSSVAIAPDISNYQSNSSTPAVEETRTTPLEKESGRQKEQFRTPVQSTPTGNSVTPSTEHTYKQSTIKTVPPGSISKDVPTVIKPETLHEKTSSIRVSVGLLSTASPKEREVATGSTTILAGQQSYSTTPYVEGGNRLSSYETTTAPQLRRKSPDPTVSLQPAIRTEALTATEPTRQEENIVSLQTTGNLQQSGKSTRTPAPSPQRETPDLTYTTDGPGESSTDDKSTVQTSVRTVRTRGNPSVTPIAGQRYTTSPTTETDQNPQTTEMSGQAEQTSQSSKTSAKEDKSNTPADPFELTAQGHVSTLTTEPANFENPTKTTVPSQGVGTTISNRSPKTNVPPESLRTIGTSQTTEQTQHGNEESQTVMSQTSASYTTTGPTPQEETTQSTISSYTKPESQEPNSYTPGYVSSEKLVSVTQLPRQHQSLAPDSVAKSPGESDLSTLSTSGQDKTARAKLSSPNTSTSSPVTQPSEKQQPIARNTVTSTPHVPVTQLPTQQTLFATDSVSKTPGHRDSNTPYKADPSGLPSAVEGKIVTTSSSASINSSPYPLTKRPEEYQPLAGNVISSTVLPYATGDTPTPRTLFHIISSPLTVTQRPPEQPSLAGISSKPGKTDSNTTPSGLRTTVTSRHFSRATSSPIPSSSTSQGNTNGIGTNNKRVVTYKPSDSPDYAPSDKTGSTSLVSPGAGRKPEYKQYPPRQDVSIIEALTQCYSVGRYIPVKGSRQWCINNCAKGFCPQFMCNDMCLVMQEMFGFVVRPGSNTA